MSIETACDVVGAASFGLLCGAAVGRVVFCRCVEVLRRMAEGAAKYACPTPEMDVVCDLLEAEQSGDDECAACWLRWAAKGGGE